jgi:hypothetical protein
MNVRIAGGYGFSLNSGNQDFSNTPSTYPLSPGIPASIEFLYPVLRNVDLGLGVYPVFMDRQFTTAEVNASAQFVPVQETDNATFLPILLSAYVNSPLTDKVRAFEGLGLGIVPATQVTSSFDQGFPGTSYGLDAALAVRAALGVEASLGHGVSLGLEVQGLFFDQHIINGTGWSASTKDLNQIAPMIEAEYGF